MSEILETTMIVCFGLSWPLNVVKAYRAGTARGTSLPFLCLIFVGYIVGVAAKLLNPVYMAQLQSKWYVLFCYCLNLLMVGANLWVYLRNLKLDRAGDGCQPRGA